MRLTTDQILGAIETHRMRLYWYPKAGGTWRAGVMNYHNGDGKVEIAYGKGPSLHDAVLACLYYLQLTLHNEQSSQTGQQQAAP